MIPAGFFTSAETGQPGAPKMTFPHMSPWVSTMIGELPGKEADLINFESVYVRRAKSNSSLE